MEKLVTLADIVRARKTIQSVIKETGVYNCSKLGRKIQGEVFLKLENLQRTGSFKLRGACNKIANLSDEEKSNGVIASSAGNHAQGVAYSATRLGISATIVMPATAPLSKIQATKDYGAKVVLEGAVYDDAYAKAREIQIETGATFLHPFDDREIIAGQGTIMLEIFEKIPDVDVVIVPIGGGGIIAGIAAAAKALNPCIRVIGVESISAPCMTMAIDKGESIEISLRSSIADGIAVRKAGTITLEHVKAFVDEIITVSESEIAQAMLFLMEKDKIIAEGAGSVSVAAILSGKLELVGKKVVAIISGGNVDINMMERVLNLALIAEGRRVDIKVRIFDRPGELEKIVKLISEEKINILQMNQSMYKNDIDIGQQEVNLVLECFGKEHRDALFKKLESFGHKVFK